MFDIPGVETAIVPPRDVTTEAYVRITKPRLQLGPSLRTLKIKGAMLYFSHSLLICALLFLLIPSVVLSQLEWCHGDSVHKKLMHFVRRVRKFSATMSRRAHPLC